MEPIAIDAMGGDNAPDEIVIGARQAAESAIPVVLVGPPDLPQRVDIGDLPLIEASEVISMDEDPAGGCGGRRTRRWSGPPRRFATAGRRR